MVAILFRSNVLQAGTGEVNEKSRIDFQVTEMVFQLKKFSTIRKKWFVGNITFIFIFFIICRWHWDSGIQTWMFRNRF